MRGFLVVAIMVALPARPLLAQGLGVVRFDGLVSISADRVAVPNCFEEQGFAFRDIRFSCSDAGALETWGTLADNYAGSPMLMNSHFISMTRTDGRMFDVLSLRVANNVWWAGRTIGVHVIGWYAGGSTVEQTFSFDPTGHSIQAQTLTLSSAFTDIVEFQWYGAADDFSGIQSDDITFRLEDTEPGVVPEPSSLLMLASGILLAGVATRRQFRA